jgi:hypothetical protein
MAAAVATLKCGELMSKPDKKPEKPYSKPTLTVYGTVRQLTGVVGHHMALDGGSIVNMTHTSL